MERTVTAERGGDDRELALLDLEDSLFARQTVRGARTYLLDRVGREQAEDADRLGLTEAVGAVDRLVLDRGLTT